MNDPTIVRLIEEIGSTENADELRDLRDRLHLRMEAMIPGDSGESVETFNAILNGMHDALIRRAVFLSEDAMARAGKGAPPVPYAYLLFGSGGRCEQTLSSDQDSGLLYEDPGPGRDPEAVRAWFRELAGLVVKTLERAGYPPCDGNVISSNEAWCDALPAWTARLDAWFDDPHWEHVRYLLILADARTVCGDERLAVRLKDHYFRNTRAYPGIAERMLQNTMRYKPLVGLFGQLLPERYGEDAGSIDIKYGAYIPLVSAVRLLAITGGIRETSTLSRIRRLRETGRLAAPDADACEAAFGFFLKLRLLAASRNKGGLYANNGKVATALLTKPMRRELRQHLGTVQRLRHSLQRQIAGKLRPDYDGGDQT
jgi:Predicted signal-transduction protein containing cAMP-binding and CBS domains